MQPYKMWQLRLHDACRDAYRGCHDGPPSLLLLAGLQAPTSGA
jgi:hypothetical protein